MIGLAHFLLLTGIGALCSLDTVSVLQAMLSRPIVSATLGGAALGRADLGVIAGVVMELFAIETMPFGASRYPEWGSAGVVAGASYVIGGAEVSGALAIATLLGLATAWLGSVSMVWHRQAVARMAGVLRERIAAGSGLAVTRLHLMGISSDLWRGAFVSAVGLMVAFVATRRMVNAWFLPYGPSAAWPVALGVAVAAASLVRAARSVPAATWFLLGGLAAGALLVVAR